MFTIRPQTSKLVLTPQDPLDINRRHVILWMLRESLESSSSFDTRFALSDFGCPLDPVSSRRASVLFGRAADTNLGAEGLHGSLERMEPASLDTRNTQNSG